MYSTYCIRWKKIGFLLQWKKNSRWTLSSLVVVHCIGDQNQMLTGNPSKTFSRLLFRIILILDYKNFWKMFCRGFRTYLLPSYDWILVTNEYTGEKDKLENRLISQIDFHKSEEATLGTQRHMRRHCCQISSICVKNDILKLILAKLERLRNKRSFLTIAKSFSIEQASAKARNRCVSLFWRNCFKYHIERKLKGL